MQIPSILLTPCEDAASIDIEKNADILRAFSNVLLAFDMCKSKHSALAELVKEEN